MLIMRGKLLFSGNRTGPDLPRSQNAMEPPVCLDQFLMTQMLVLFVPPAAFKEICPAGPGYHYSASTLQFSQRVDGDPTGRGSVLTSQDRPSTSGSFLCSLTGSLGRF